jgi:hypothetical protein
VIAATTAVGAIALRAALPIVGAQAIAIEAGIFAAVVLAWYLFVLSPRERQWCRQRTLQLRRAT